MKVVVTCSRINVKGFPQSGRPEVVITFWSATSTFLLPTVNEVMSLTCKVLDPFQKSRIGLRGSIPCALSGSVHSIFLKGYDHRSFVIIDVVIEGTNAYL